MRFYGNIALNQNEIQNAVIQSETSWPTNPKVGQLLFMNKIVYICVALDNTLPVWVPLTQELTMHVHTQTNASSTWTITHPLNTVFAQVQVFDGNNEVVIPDFIEIINSSTISVRFSGYQDGRAVVLTGTTEGNQKPTYAYEFNQTSPSTTWVIPHNLGYHPIIRIFAGQYEIQPLSIAHDSNNQVTITFSSPQTGVAKLV